MSARPETDPRALVSDPIARAMLGGISAMTAIRWGRDPKVGWLKVAAVVRGRKFYFRRDVEALADKLIAATASGEATTVAPNPHRRSAKKPQPAGGLVT